MLKVLYIGGVYATEYSLYRESLVNPNIELSILFNGEGMTNVGNGLEYKVVTSREDIDKEKALFDPDLTIFRSWCHTSSALVKDGAPLSNTQTLFVSSYVGSSTPSGQD